MFRYVLKSKCVILCVILMMCPRKTRLSSSVENLNQDYETPSNDWEEKAKSVVHIQDRADIELVYKPRPVNDERGFDLTEQEMVKFKIWPQGVIPYYIDVHSFSDKVLRDRIRSFLNTVNSVTSLNFLELPSPPQDTQSRWVFFLNRRGLLNCADHSVKNFTNQGVQQVVLGYDCMSTGDELSEAVLSIVGVPAQHNAPNREMYIQVIQDNIMPEKKQLFEQLKDNEWLFHDIDYDFGSAGHYHFHKYSVNGRATIEAKKNFVDVPVGETKGLSESDIRKIKMLYNYISKKKQMNVPECHKLFGPGKDFSSYIPESDDNKPRRKPDKYLGVPGNPDDDETQDKNKEESTAHHDDSENIEINDAGINANAEHKVLKYRYDPLTVLSDYETGDEQLSKNIAMKKPHAKIVKSDKQLLLFKKAVV